MKHLVRDKKAIALISLSFVIMYFSLTGQAQAVLYCNSGTCAHVQDEGVLASPFVYYGWGMDFTLKAFSTTWAHISVPLPYQPGTKRVNFVQAEVHVIGDAGWVSEVHVYSGGALLKKFDVNWVGPNQNYFLKLYLGGVNTYFGPISISLLCKSGDGNTRFVIKRACANLVKK